MLLHLISSFLLIRSFFVRYAQVSIESIDCILLSSFELKANLLIFSVKRSCLSPLNLVVLLICFYCFYKFFLTFYKTCTSVLLLFNWINLFSSCDACKQFLQSSNLNFLFITLLFVPFAFLL